MEKMKGLPMKKNLFPLFSALALVSAAAMLFFTFFTLGWFSDVRGWECGFELQINTADGALTAMGDIFWTAAPIALLFSLLFGVFSEKGGKFSALLSVLPLSLYALCQICLYFGGKETRLPTWATLFFLILVGIFTVASAFFSELENFATLFPFLHLAAELLLFFLSLILQEKISAYYFSELLPMGHTSYFRYTFVLWSILFYYLFYSAALGFWALAKKHRSAYFLSKQAKEKTVPKKMPPPEEEPFDSKDTEVDIPGSISLEDLGIER